MSGDGSRDGGFGGRIPWARRASLLPDQPYCITESVFIVSQFGVFIWVDHGGASIRLDKSFSCKSSRVSQVSFSAS
jgi:hypothetical protein